MDDFLLDPAVPIIAGQSHCTSLGVPRQLAGGVSRLVPLSNGDRRFCGFAGAWPRLHSFWGELAAAARGRTVVLVWGGNQHNAAFLLCPGRPLDFVLRERPHLPLDPGAVIIPDTAIEERLSAPLPALRRNIQALKANGATRVVIGGTPAPKKDSEALRRGVCLAVGAFHAQAQRMGLKVEDVPLSAPLFRYKAWCVVQRLLEQVAREQAVEFVPVPAASLEDGLLRDEYAKSDATHANAAYGQLFLDHLHAYLTGTRHE